MPGEQIAKECGAASDLTLRAIRRQRGGMEVTALDAVITGNAYEEATTAIGVLEAGSEGNGRISSEMLCTLDNFVQAVLFHERIFLTISP